MEKIKGILPAPVNPERTQGLVDLTQTPKLKPLIDRASDTIIHEESERQNMPESD